ncbi:PAS domain-containing protein [Bacillus sp. AFS073361]|uniref:PAS domain-containing protein n=1 Tax=Bacillus sp. AFS073361 TaxID=2033511 RepID=UPI0015D46EA6|nr:PAS domain-containing protein [Bacillus sp. AFS073361]
MKLVNIAERFKDKKEIIHQIAQIAPEILLSKNIGEMVEKLGNIGAVTLEEKTYCEMRLQAKKICLMVELIFKRHGIEGFSGLNFVDRENEYKLGKLVVVSHPHLPHEFVDHFDGKEILPFGGSCARSMVLNRVVEVQNIENSLLFSDEQVRMMKKFGFYSNISFPIHYDNGELIGSLFFIHGTKKEICEESKAEIRELIVNLEHILTLLQEGWSNKEIICFKGIMTTDFIMAYVEPICEDMIGYGPQDMFYTKSLEFFIHPDDKERVYKNLQPLHDGKSARTLFRCITRKGTYVTLEMLCVPVKELGGDIRYIENYVMLNTDSCKGFDNLLQEKMAH